MKKVLLISMIFWSALLATAQMPQIPDPQQRWVIRQAEARYRSSYNDKSKPHLKPTNLNGLSKQTEQAFTELHEQEGLNRMGYNFFDLEKDYGKYCSALKKARKAEEKKDEAEKAYTGLFEKQQREKAKLQVSGGMDYDRMQGLEKRHAKQIARAQQNVEKATRNYDEALKNLKLARLELEKYR